MTAATPHAGLSVQPGQLHQYVKTKGVIATIGVSWISKCTITRFSTRRSQMRKIRFVVAVLVALMIAAPTLALELTVSFVKDAPPVTP